jgi:hypothetical protein
LKGWTLVGEVLVGFACNSRTSTLMKRRYHVLPLVFFFSGKMGYPMTHLATGVPFQWQSKVSSDSFCLGIHRQCTLLWMLSLPRFSVLPPHMQTLRREHHPVE